MARQNLRGFEPYKPRGEAQDILDNINLILQDYAASLPLTLRQVFYRLVAEYGYEKDEVAYKKLGKIVGWARRGQLLSFDAIRTDNVHQAAPAETYVEPGDYLETILASLPGWYREDVHADQDERLVVWCEAAGMLPIVNKVASAYRLQVFSSSGFDSITHKHNTALAWAKHYVEHEQRHHVIHIGDFDPSGVKLFEVLVEDMKAFYSAYYPRGAPWFTRALLLPEHIEEYEIETAPAKEKDNNTRNWTGLPGDPTATAQLEALRPDQIQGVIEEAITEHLDMDAFNAAIERESEQRERVNAWVNKVKEIEV